MQATNRASRADGAHLGTGDGRTGKRCGRPTGLPAWNAMEWWSFSRFWMLRRRRIA